MSDQAHQDYNLPPRRESILARYPRNLKMIVTVIILALLILPPAFIHGRLHRHAEGEKTSSSSADMDVTNFPSATVGKVESDVNAPALNDQDDRGVKLIAAPDSRVTEDTAEGSLPRISEDGIRPWQVYARPFNSADKRPRIAIVVTDLGLSRAITDQAINQLPPTVTLSFNAQGTVVAAWGERARQDGHEIFLQVPMEPFDYPQSDPGPDTLLTTLPNGDNLGRLLRILRRATGYVGVTSTSGSRFTTDSNKLTPMLAALRDRGLMVLDARAAPHSVMNDLAHTIGVPAAAVTERLDSDLSPDAIAEALDDLEKTARQNGRAIGITSPSPIMLAQLQAWAKTLPQHGIALAPVSAMVQ